MNLQYWKPSALALLTLLSQLAAPKPTWAGNLSPVQLTEDGGNHQWLLLAGSGSDDQLKASGHLQSKGYYLLPKQVKFRIEILQQGNALRVYFPSPQQFEPGPSAPGGADEGLHLPAGLPKVNSAYLGDRAELLVKEEFKTWISQLDNQATLNYRDPSVRGREIRSMPLRDFNLDAFLKATRSVFGSGEEAFITFITKRKTFTQADIQSISKYFSIRITNIVTQASPLVFEYSFPDASFWAHVDSRDVLPFYRAYDQLDSQLFPLFVQSSVFRSLESPSLERFWRRRFLDSAFEFYFQNASPETVEPQEKTCTAYSVKLRTVPSTSDHAFKATYFQPTIGSIELNLELGEK